MALGLSALVVACEDTTQPPAPPKPDQVEMSVVYSNTQDNKGLPSNDVYAFLAVSNGEFWVGTSAGVARFPNANTSVRPPANLVNEINGLPHPHVRSMAEIDGKVYVATWGGGLGVYDIAGETWTQVRPGATGLTDGFIAELATSPTEDKLYLATNDGVFIFAPSTSTWSHFSTVTADPLDFDVVRLQQTVSSLEVRDDLGIVQRWYGPRVEIRVDDPSLYGIMVSKGASTEYMYTPTNSGLVESNVNDIYFDADRGTYWVSYVRSGISEVNVDAKTWTDYTQVQGLPSNTVYSITRASDFKGGTTVWAATQNGLARLSGSKWESFGRSSGLPGDRVRKVYSDDGHRLWLGFVDGGAARVSGIKKAQS